MSDPKELAENILKRMEIDETKDDAELVIVYHSGGALRRILVNELPSPTLAPKRYITGSDLRALCLTVLHGAV